MRLGRFIRPVIRRGACRSPSPTRNGHVERGRRGVQAKAQEARWAARKVETGSRKESRINARVEMKEQAPESKVGHRERVEGG